MVSNTTQRVPQHTRKAVNDRIQDCTFASLQYYAAHPEEIPQRLRELDREWDIERVLELGSSSLSLAGLALAAGRRSLRWLALPLTVQAFFLQHTLQGWCPPLPLFRRLGFRTQAEIGQERAALKALRGDFEAMEEKSAAAAYRAATRR